MLLAPLGFALTWFLLGGKLRTIAQRHKVYSVPDLVHLRYGGPSARVWMSIAIVIGSIGYMTAQVVAAGIITMLLLGLPFTVSLLIGAAVVGMYTVAGGMLAAVWTDMVQGAIMIVMSFVVFFVSINLDGGWIATVGTLREADSKLVSLDGVQPVVWIAANILLIALGAMGQPQLIHKFLMLKSSRELRWGASIAGAGYAITTLFIVGIGLSSRGQILGGTMDQPANPDNVAPEFLGQFTLPIIAALALTALLAAIMSSASSFITIGASAVTRDLFGGLGKPLRRELMWTRIASAGVTIAAVLVAVFLDQIIYLLGAIGWAAFAGAIIGPVVIGLYWKRGTTAGVLAAVIGSLSINVFFAIAPRVIPGWSLPPHFFSGLAVIVAGIVLYIVVSLLTANARDSLRFERLRDSFPDERAAETSALAGNAADDGQRSAAAGPGYLQDGSDK